MQNEDAGALRLGWSDFAAARCTPGSGRTHFRGSPDELVERVRAAWPRRRPGAGRADLAQVVVVPVAPDGFVGGTVLVGEDDALIARLVRRQPHEEPYLEVLADAAPEPVRHAAVVLYSAATLLENGGRRSGDYDWEIVALVAGPTEDEPMDPLTMARNMLEMPGGTRCAYTAEQFAAAIWYWARRARVLPSEAARR